MLEASSHALIYNENVYGYFLHTFLESDLIHEENTKENHKRIVFWYCGKKRP